MKKISRVFTAVLAAAMLLALTACGGDKNPSGSNTPGNSNAPQSSAPAGQSYELMMGGNATSGSFYQWAVPACDLISKYGDGVTAVAMPTAGGTENIKFMQAGDLDMGGGVLAMSYSAYYGQNGWTAYPDMSAFVCSYGDFVQLVVRADSGIQTIEDLKGKRVNFEVAGNSSNENLRKLLSIIGYDAEDFCQVYEMSTTEAVAAMQEGLIDCCFYQLGLTNSGIKELENSRCGLKVVDWGKEYAEKIAAEWPVYTVKTIPAGTYKDLDYDVTTIGGATVVMINNNVPEDVVYRAIKAICEHHDEFVQANANAVETTAEFTVEALKAGEVLPIHPGCVRYFQELGLM